MKLPVTMTIVEEVLRDAHAGGRLETGLFGSGAGSNFCGCAVGNILNDASGRTLDGFQIEVVGASSCWNAPTSGNESAAFAAADGLYLNAISCVFESTYDGTGKSIDAVISRLREILPSRFSIDIDGLRAMPVWRKKSKRVKT